MTDFPSEQTIHNLIRNTQFYGSIKIPVSLYNDAAGYLRNSTVSSLKRSREKCRYQLDHGSEVTKPFSFGTALHTRVLTPEDWESSIAVMPKVDGRTKAGKEKLEEFVSSSVGKTVISQDEFDSICAMNTRLSGSPIYNELMLNTERELSAFFSWDGTPCKARFDAIGGGRIVDIKSTESCSFHDFQNSLATYGYHRQAAFYLEAAKECGLDVNEFIFVAIEKKPPYQFSIYKIDYASLEKGREEIEWLLIEWRKAQAENDWVSSGKCVEAINLPAWAF